MVGSGGSRCMLPVEGLIIRAAMIEVFLSGSLDFEGNDDETRKLLLDFLFNGFNEVVEEFFLLHGEHRIPVDAQDTHTQCQS